ncbi:MAG: arginine--tRNA ligase, partial [Planctomycetia bacterium]
MPACLAYIERLYKRMNVKFDHQMGESFFHPMMPAVVEKLRAAGVAENDAGAVCVFFRDPAGKVDDDGKPIQKMPPAIVQKTDGAYTYSTSDLACVEYRIETFKPDVVAYVVDKRQELHFEQIFTTMGRLGCKTELVHVAFGTVLGTDGKPIKTREGDPIGLESLIDEAIERSLVLVKENLPKLTSEEQKEVAEVIGVGAVKYADLSQSRLTDYKFDWDKMISFQGATGAYLQYAYARTRSIFREGGIDEATILAARPKLVFENAVERTLALTLARYAEAVEASMQDYRPNVLATYLLDVAGEYARFWNECPVVKAEEPLRTSRLALCSLTAKVLKQGLGLLGIGVVER